MPAYNEEGSIREAVLEIHEAILSSVPNSKLLVVNDGSRDSTKAKLDELTKLVPCLRVIHQKNAGHGPAIYGGACQARSDFLFLLDSDRQIPIQSFYDLWKVRASLRSRIWHSHGSARSPLSPDIDPHRWCGSIRFFAGEDSRSEHPV